MVWGPMFMLMGQMFFDFIFCGIIDLEIGV